MRTLLDKAAMFALCLILHITLTGDMRPGSVVALLAAVCCTSLCDWLPAARLRPLMPGCYAVMACLSAEFLWFLPPIAYDAMRLRPLRLVRAGASHARGSGTDEPPRWMTAVSCWLWVAPLTMRLFGLGADRGQAGPDSYLIVVVAAVGALLGESARRCNALDAGRTRIEDESRDMLRRYRIRLADGSEERAAAIHTATVNERTRIARDIHDNVGHLLTRAIMQAEAGRLVAEAGGAHDAARGFAQIHDTADQAMTMIRRSVHDLEDNGTDFAAQIHAAAHAFDGAADFDVRLRNDIRTAPAPVARCLAAVIREAVSNVAHHSDAAQVSVLLHEFPAFWQLTVQDDGGRMPHAAATAPRGMGLADIEARVRALGGTALCGPFNDGWRVFASIPKTPWTAEGGRA